MAGLGGYVIIVPLGLSPEIRALPLAQQDKGQRFQNILWRLVNGVAGNF